MLICEKNKIGKRRDTYMPQTATIEDIKAYQEKVEKNKITPPDLPRCSRCQLESHLFKVHAYRERLFLIIVQMLLKWVRARWVPVL
jgi:hypothetical protein